MNSIEKSTKPNTLGTRPDLICEWDFKKNGELSPFNLSLGCNKRAWWKCSVCGHEWNAIISSRGRQGSGCPMCAKKKISESLHKHNLSSKVTLAVSGLPMLDEWDWERNEITPNQITYGSETKVWWKCKKGHSWLASPNGRRVSGCPICRMERQTSFPEQAVFFYVKKLWKAENRYKLHRRELDIFIPSLNVGIEYDGEYYHRSTSATAREKEKDEFFSLNGITVVRIKELHRNDERRDNSDNIYYYRPDAEYKNLEPVIYTVISELSGSGMPIDFDINIERDRSLIMQQYAEFEKENSLAYLRPDLVPEWDFEANNNLQPDQVSGYSKLKAHWVCSGGHKWQAAVYSRIAGNGCPYCSGKILTIGKNDLKSQNPTLAEEWDYERNGDLLPEQITVNNGKKVWWKCKNCGNSWMATVAHRNSGRGCPICAKIISASKINRTKIKNVGSLKTVFPDLAAEWDYEKNAGLLPDDFAPGSSRKVWWKCRTCGNEWEAFISNRSKGVGCPKCAKAQRVKTATMNRIQVQGSLEDRFPSVAAEWDNEKNGELTPSEVLSGSSKRVWWKCQKCGFEWQAIISNRTGKGQGCPACRKAVRNHV